MEQNELELVRRAKQGGADAADAFAKLYEMICKDLYRTALYTLGNAADAENIVSDTVLDAYAGIGKLREETAFRAWIFRILSNKLKRQLAEYAARREKLSPAPVEEYAESLGKEEEGLQKAELQDEILFAFQVLSEEERQIVTMTVYGAKDSGEIASLLGLNRNTVRSKYSRALGKLRERLTGQRIAQGIQ